MASTTGGRMRVTARTGPPETAGRWALLPTLDTDPTRRAHATAERLLDRHGVVIRGAVVSERTPGGFAAAYKVLSAFEETGRCRRGYFVDGLGAAQFGTAGAIDRLRTFSETDPNDKPVARCLAATDPANPYGAALAWPASDGGHRPGRKAGSLVVLVDGELTIYVERGGKTLLTWSEDAELLAPAAEALAEAARRGSLGRPAARVGLDPRARGAAGRRLPGHPAGAQAEELLECLRATPSTAPPGCSTVP
jgi:ATP-dependent Lhr-like helicase